LEKDVKKCAISNRIVGGGKRRGGEISEQIIRISQIYQQPWRENAGEKVELGGFR